MGAMRQSAWAATQRENTATAFFPKPTSETQGLTYIEALAAGVPALCRADPCLCGVIREGENGGPQADAHVVVHKAPHRAKQQHSGQTAQASWAESLFKISPRMSWRRIFRPDCVKNPCHPSGCLRIFALQGKKSTRQSAHVEMINKENLKTRHSRRAAPVLQAEAAAVLPAEEAAGVQAHAHTLR